MVRESPVSDWMSTEVVSFRPDENVRDAMRRLVQTDVDGGPVVDAEGRVVGVLSTSDLIVKEAELHFPTVFNFLGVDVQWPSFKHRHLDDDIAKALGATVGEVMDGEPVVVAPTATLETAATLMHDEDVSRLPVVDGGRLVGLLSRNDVLRAVLADESSDVEATGASGSG
jgi:CBS domain-containing protein